LGDHRCLRRCHLRQAMADAMTMSSQTYPLPPGADPLRRLDSRRCAACTSRETSRAGRLRIHQDWHVRGRPPRGERLRGDPIHGLTVLLCLVCGRPCRATQGALPTASWAPEAVPTKVCRGTPFVTAEGKGSQAWGIHYGA
jgi:hypothetical protein